MVMPLRNMRNLDIAAITNRLSPQEDRGPCWGTVYTAESENKIISNKTSHRNTSFAFKPRCRFSNSAGSCYKLLTVNTSTFLTCHPNPPGFPQPHPPDRDMNPPRDTRTGKGSPAPDHIGSWVFQSCRA